MDYRVETEKTIHNLVIEILTDLAPHKDLAPIKRSRFDLMETLGKLRDIKKILDYKSLGCPMGVHASYCLCSHNVIHTEDWLSRQKKKVA